MFTQLRVLGSSVDNIQNYAKSLINSMNSHQFYSWKNLRCAYTVYNSDHETSETPALLLIHPIGVGLSGIFWDRFIEAWLEQNPESVVYNPDLLGCGASEMPAVAYYPVDWAAQLQYFLETVVKKPVVLVVQGALFPVAIKLLQKLGQQSHFVTGLVLSGPPAWRIMTEPAKPLQQKLLWNLLFNSPFGLGNLFYLYARRRKFIESFSVRQLFGEPQKVDQNWLDSLTQALRIIKVVMPSFPFSQDFGGKITPQRLAILRNRLW